MANSRAFAGEKFDYSPQSPTSVRTGDAIIDIPDDKRVATNEDLQERPHFSWVSSWSFSPFKRGSEIKETITRTLEDCPNGYPKLAAFQSSDNNFMLYRQFSYLHSRVLLNLQDEIAELERELDEIDHMDFENDEGHLLQSRAKDVRNAQRNGIERGRREILADIKTKLMEYDDVLIKAKELVSFQRPAERDYNSVRTWYHNLAPLVEREQNFIKCKEDIITLRHGRECAGFDGFVEYLLHKMNSRIIRYIFCTPELRHKTNDKHVYYFSPSRVDTLVGLLITIVIFALLVAPVMAMYKLTAMGGSSSSPSTFRAIGVLIT